ncbi:hypothetical protein [Planctomonas deserti]|uniref:hypothetical protein n=1 Tax=Planctomonas deserti TaxID=2144185 RepID=UPI00131F29A8|nr:hypothetical protein [Planctomonas deserti]
MRDFRLLLAVSAAAILVAVAGCASPAGSGDGITPQAAPAQPDTRTDPDPVDTADGEDEPADSGCDWLSSEQIEAGDQAAASGEFVDWVDYQTRFGAFAESLRVAYPDDYSTARVEPACLRGFISFKDEIPLELLGGDIAVEDVTFTGNVGLSEKDIENRMSQISDIAQAELSNGLSTGGYDHGANAFQLDYVNRVGGPPPPTEAQLDALRARLAEEVDLPDGIRVLVNYDPTPTEATIEF